jgi:hypothetical protein
LGTHKVACQILPTRNLHSLTNLIYICKAL